MPKKLQKNKPYFQFRRSSLLLATGLTLSMAAATSAWAQSRLIDTKPLSMTGKRDASKQSYSHNRPVQQSRTQVVQTAPIRFTGKRKKP